MGEARVLMDRLTAAVTGKDLKGAEACYTADAVAVTPEQGEITGREAVVEYLKQFVDAFPDLRYRPIAQHESGNVAIDEGYIEGTHSGPLPMPSGESIPATGRHVRMRSCDVAVVVGGLIAEHRFYYDQMEFSDQLGLLPGQQS